MIKKTIIKILILVIVSGAGLFAENSINQDDLSDVLKKTAEYCDLLKSKVFHFICNEKVTEILHKSLQYPKKKRGLKNFLTGIKPGTEGPSKYPVYQHLKDSQRNRHYAPKTNERKSVYINEYQIMKKGKKLKEMRKLLKFNGKKVDKNFKNINRMQTRIYSYKTVLAPIHFFASENQNQYDYKIIDKNKRSYVIEIKKKANMDNSNMETELENQKTTNVLLTAWVDSGDFSIIKFEVHPEAFGGTDYLFKRSGREKRNIRIVDTHFFSIKKDGVRYPSKTKISISYNEDPQKNISTGRGERNFGAEVLVKLSTTYKYKKYAFFNVSVENPVYHNLVEEE